MDQKPAQPDQEDLLVRPEGRDIQDLVEEAIRQFLEAAAVTDLDVVQVAEAQVKLVGELRGVEEWKGDRA